MITLEAQDRRIVIHSDYPMRDKERLRQLPGSKYDLRSQRWTAPLTWGTCQAVRGMFGEELTVGPELTRWSVEHFTDHVQPALALRTAMDAEGDDDLYPFQRAGVRFLSYAEKALLCDEMGTGKTPQTIRTLKALHDRGRDVFPAVVVAPNNMVLTWRSEFERFWPGVKVGVVRGPAKQRREVIEDESNQVLVINFEAVRMHSRLRGYGSVRLKRCYECDPTMPRDTAHKPQYCEVHPKELNRRDFRSLVVDEAHRLKDPKAKQTMAVTALRGTSTDFVYGLTGTAIADSPVDLYSMLYLVSPEEFPSRVAYIDRYCLASYNLFGGMEVVGLNPHTRDEFFRVVDPHMRRMPKDAVLPWLPAKQYSKRYVEMSAKQAKAYRQMDENMISVLGDGEGLAVAANPLTALTRLVQFSSSYAEVDEEGRVRLVGPSSKVDALVEWANDNPQEPAVVFAQSRQLIDLASEQLTRMGVPHSLITGGQDQVERERAKEDFQEGRVRFILCTIAAGGIGITLTRSRVAIFLQRSWSMIENKQAEDRVHRIGSERHDSIEIIDFVSPGTVEEAQQLALAGKLDRLEELMRDRETVARVRQEMERETSGEVVA